MGRDNRIQKSPLTIGICIKSLQNKAVRYKMNTNNRPRE